MSWIDANLTHLPAKRGGAEQSRMPRLWDVKFAAQTRDEAPCFVDAGGLIANATLVCISDQDGRNADDP